VQNEEFDGSDGDMLSVSTTQFSDVWILDSGYSYHIMSNREWFTTYRSANSGCVYLGDNRCCNIVGIGDVRIRMYDDIVRTLCDVRHIPELKKNLISLGTLHKNNQILKKRKYNFLYNHCQSCQIQFSTTIYLSSSPMSYQKGKMDKARPVEIHRFLTCAKELFLGNLYNL